MNMNTKHLRSDWVMQNKPSLYMPMIETADIVAKRYGVSREAQDQYALQSQQRTAAAQQAGRFDAEIDPAHRRDGGREQGDEGDLEAHTYTLEKDEGNRPETRSKACRS